MGVTQNILTYKCTKYKLKQLKKLRTEYIGTKAWNNMQWLQIIKLDSYQIKTNHSKYLIVKSI